MSGEDVALVREALGSGERLVPGTMSEKEHEAFAALDRLEARIAEISTELDATLTELITVRVRIAEDDRKVEAYDAARAQVKREGCTRAEYVLRAEAAEVRNKALTAALREALDIIVWMSGSDDFSPDGKAHVGWVKARDQLDPLFLLARHALATSEQAHTEEGAA